MSKTLYKYTKTGSVQTWVCFSDGDEVVSIYGQLDGKLQESRYTCEAKNVGRSNATTPEQQAIAEVESAYEDRIQNKHYRETLEEAQEVVDACIVPMKVINYKDHPNKVKYPCMISTKKNGSRAMFKDGKVISKAGRVEEFKVGHITDQVKQLSMDVDGEVYRHGWSLQRIQSARKKPNEDTPELELHVFDIPVRGKTLSERNSMLVNLKQEVAQKGLSHIKVCIRWAVMSQDQLDYSFEYDVSKGYEGLVIWNEGGMYEFGNRSNEVLKWKPRYDSEAKIIDVTKDKNGNGKLHLQACDALGNVKFKAMMKVHRRDGKEYPRDYDSMCAIKGKWITFSYEELSDKGVPLKPIGESIRVCDNSGEPLE